MEYEVDEDGGPSSQKAILCDKEICAAKRKDEMALNLRPRLILTKQVIDLKWNMTVYPVTKIDLLYWVNLNMKIYAATMAADRGKCKILIYTVLIVVQGRGK